MIVIDAKIRANPALDALKKLQQTLSAINKAVSVLNAQLGQTASAAATAAQQMKGVARAGSRQGGGSGARGSSGKPPLAFASNPVAGMQAYASGAAAGNTSAAKMFATYQRMHSAQQRAQANAQLFMKGGGTPLAAILQGVIGSTRFANIGGKQIGMPLGWAMQSLRGMPGGASALSGIMGGTGGAGAAGGAVAGGAMVGAGAIAAAFAVLALETKLLIDSFKEAMASLGAWSAALVRGGGTPGQARAVTRLNDALGIDVGGVGRNLMSGYGPIAAAMAGVNPFGGPFGDNDYNKKGLAVLDRVRKAKSLNEARRIAELAGSPDMANAYLLSNSTYKALRSDQAGQGSMSNMKGAAEFKANATLLSDSLKDLMITVAGPIIKEAAPIIGRLAAGLRKLDPTRLRRLAELIMTPLQALEGMLGILKAALVVLDKVRDFFKWLWNFLAKLLEKFHIHLGNAPDDPQTRAVKENTRATVDNTQAVREGTYGGGQRAANAMPSKMNPLSPGWHAPGYGVL